MGFFDKYITSYGRSIKDGYKTNAFAPVAWFIFFLVGIIFIILFVSITIIKYVFAFLLVGLVIFGCVMYARIFNKDPKLLQSEKYRIDDKTLDIIQQKGGEIKFLEIDLSHNAEIKGGGVNE